MAPKPNDPPVRSPAQEALENRRRCYQERIVRRLVIRHGADAAREEWETEAGWGDTERARYKPPPARTLFGKELQAPAQYLSGLTYSTFDVLKYQTPKVVPCSKFDEHPVIPAGKDDSIQIGR